MKKEKSAAILTVFNAPNMTPKGRRQIVAWLKRQTSFLEKYPDQLARRWTARYLY